MYMCCFQSDTCWMFWQKTASILRFFSTKRPFVVILRKMVGFCKVLNYNHLRERPFWRQNENGTLMKNSLENFSSKYRFLWVISAFWPCHIGFLTLKSHCFMREMPLFYDIERGECTKMPLDSLWKQQLWWQAFVKFVEVCITGGTVPTPPFGKGGALHNVSIYNMVYKAK